MKNRGSRNKLSREGVTYQELQGQKGTGFVMRILNEEVRPPQITTVVKQPGQEHLTVMTIETEVDCLNPLRLYRGIPIQPESTDAIVNMLKERTEHNPLAQVALQHLATAIPEVQ